jgi:hypothetical protein
VSARSDGDAASRVRRSRPLERELRRVPLEVPPSDGRSCSGIPEGARFRPPAGRSRCRTILTGPRAFRVLRAGRHLAYFLPYKTSSDAGRH